MINRVTKKYILEGAKICQQNGYWSEELRNYFDNFSQKASNKLCSILCSLYNSNNPQASIHYNLVKNAGLLENVKEDCLLSSKEQQIKDKLFVKNEYEKVKDKLSKCTLETIIDNMIK